jgi:hypothetical protein
LEETELADLRFGSLFQKNYRVAKIRRSQILRQIVDGKMELISTRHLFKKN